MRIKEVAKFLGTSVTQVKKLIRNGILKGDTIDYIKVLVVEPLNVPISIRLEANIFNLQNISGYRIKIICPFNDNVAIVSNYLCETSPNRTIYGEYFAEDRNIIYGTFLICGIQGNRFISLTDEQIDKYANIFWEQEDWEQEDS